MEEEIQNHSKKAFQKWFEKGLPFWQKAIAIALEIAIMVFAVSLSIAFNNMSNKRQKDNDVKEFLLGLKADLVEDIKEMESDRASYYEKKAAYTYLYHLKIKENVSKDTLKKYGNVFSSSVQLLPNMSLFEGFKSAGKLSDIENHALQSDILDLYQNDIPSLLSSTNAYLKNGDLLNNFIVKNRKRLTDTTDNFLQLAKYDEARNIIGIMQNTEQTTERYTNCIDKMKKIILQIEKEYK